MELRYWEEKKRESMEEGWGGKSEGCGRWEIRNFNEIKGNGDDSSRWRKW